MFRKSFSVIEDKMNSDEDEEEEEECNEDEADDDEFENSGAVITPWQTLPKVLEQFRCWLISPDAKAKPPRQADQHAQQVVKILTATSSDNYQFKNLFDRKCVRDMWLIHFENSGRTPATVKAYPLSLRHFYSFVIADEPVELAKFKVKCPALILNCTDWISLFRKKQTKNRWKKDLKQLTQLFKAEEIQQLDSSDLVKYCQKTFQEMRSVQKPPTLRQFSNARNYILMYLCLDNASRTGALANMTVGEFKQAQLKNGSYRINVVDHKTIGTSGPACIVARYELFQEMLVYFERMRNTLDGMRSLKSDPVFVSWSGKKMSSSMVTAQINSFWGKTVGHSEIRPRINGALVRKSAVSKVHSGHEGLKTDLANLMCHSEETAKRIYYLQEKTKKAGETSSSLRSILRKPDEDDSLEKAIHMHFEEDIEKGKIRMTVVREKKSRSPALAALTDACLRDKIRYLIEKRKPESSSESKYCSTFVVNVISFDQNSHQFTKVTVE